MTEGNEGVPVAVRPEREGDEAAITQVHDRAFGQPQEGRLVTALRTSTAYIADLSLVAEAHGRVVGHILFSRVEVIGQRPGPAVALAPMAVAPELQGRGIGSILVRAGIAGSRRRGESLVVVLGHPGYYPRFGFSPAGVLGVHAPFDVPPEAWMVLALAVDHPLGTVRYPAAFEAVT